MWEEATLCAETCGTELSCAESAASFVYLPYFCFSIPRDAQESFRAFDGFRFGIRSNEREPTHQLLRLGKGPIRYADFPIRLPHAGTQRTRQASFRRQQDPLLHPLLDQLPHPLDFLLRRRSAFLLRGLIDA